MILYCKKCKSQNYVKAGFVTGEQRYLCKDCGCKFVPTRQKGKCEKTKMTAVWLYCHGFSFRTIAKFFNVNVRSVFNWVKAYAKANYVKPIPESDAVVIELDEMWHFIQSKKLQSGFGRLIAVIPINLSTGSVEGEIKLHFQSSISG
jgi:transposase-like protein